MRCNPHPLRVHRKARTICRADWLGVLWLGRDFFVVSLNPDRYFRTEIRGDELRLPLYRPGRRLDPRWTGRCLSQADNRQLDIRIPCGRGARRHNGIARHYHVAAPAAAAFCYGIDVSPRCGSWFDTAPYGTKPTSRCAQPMSAFGGVFSSFWI